MALLNVEEEMARARTGWPFSNGFEFDNWYSIWCEDCSHCESCPLLTIIIFGRIPESWDDANPGSLNRWHCNEFERVPSDEAPTVQIEKPARPAPLEQHRVPELRKAAPGQADGPDRGGLLVSGEEE